MSATGLPPPQWCPACQTHLAYVGDLCPVCEDRRRIERENRLAAVTGR